MNAALFSNFFQHLTSGLLFTFSGVLLFIAHFYLTLLSK
jgi:hypothetical protein